MQGREKQQRDPSARKAVVSWTGGKDCNLSLLHAWRDPSLDVVALICFKPEGGVFRAHPTALMEKQAEALRLPLMYIPINATPEYTYKDAYVEGMKRLKAEHGIFVVVTGDMDYVGTSDTNWMSECGEEAGLDVIIPLWKRDREQCLREMIDEGLEVIFSCVKAPYFDGTWIGRRIDDESLLEMKKIVAESSEGETCLDLGGERGEYHTMCLNGPLYSHRVDINLTAEPKVLIAKPHESKNWSKRIHVAAEIWCINADDDGA